ncbi:MAG TPA: phosphorylase [Burkholderiales bacterium]|nr:phosphorylase [Burkholderiales bacterium]
MITASLVQAATARALASGALQPIAAQTELIDGFVVRAASTMAAKAAAPPRADPLGDYEPDLFLGDVGSAHYALLNKFPVVPNHLLLVTRRFAPQEELLDAADFAALAAVMAELDWLAFYNAGRDAGASQARKHLQLAPAGVPLEPLITRGALPFRHAVASLPRLDAMHDVYRALIAPWARAPYNLLATRRWMLVVPRRQARYESLSVNALGFAGSLLVRNSAELESVRRAGPMNVLRAVTLE